MFRRTRFDHDAENGANPKVVQDALRHANPRMTLDVLRKQRHRTIGPTISCGGIEVR